MLTSNVTEQAATKTAKAKPTKTTKAPAAKAKTTDAAPAAKAATPKPKAKATAGGGTITVVSKQNPHAAGTRRAGWFRQLKTGMSVADAVELGVRSIYLRRMEAKGVIKITK